MLLKSRELRAKNPLAMRTYPEEVNLGLLVSKHLRPISLTPILSKLGEDFVVDRHVKPACFLRLILGSSLAPFPIQVPQKP